MKITQIITIYIFAKIHAKGWCKSWHRSEYIQKTSGRGECHLIDHIALILYPRIEVENDK